MIDFNLFIFNECSDFFYLNVFIIFFVDMINGSVCWIRGVYLYDTVNKQLQFLNVFICQDKLF